LLDTRISRAGTNNASLQELENKHERMIYIYIYIYEVDVGEGSVPSNRKQQVVNSM